MFDGFLPPTENWSKLPHQFIEALPLIKTIGEMKVILYVLRHTWGYHDTEKRITLEEFENGRKRKDGTRIDSGTGLARNTVKDGIERAVEHGFLEYDEDASDRARVKRTYRLAESGGQKLTLNNQEVTPRGSRVDPRSEKDTPERNPLKERAKARAATEEPQAKPTTMEYALVGVPDWAAVVVRCKNPLCDGEIQMSGLRRSAGECPHCHVPLRVRDEHGKVLVRLPQGARRKSEGLKEWLPAVRAFCELSPNVDYGKLPGKVRGQWAREMRDLACDMTPGELADVIPRLGERMYQIQELTTPRQDRFARALMEHRMAGPSEDDVWLGRLRSLYALPESYQVQLAERFDLRRDGDLWLTRYGEPLAVETHSEEWRASE